MGIGTTVPITGVSGGGLPIPDAQSVLGWVETLARIAVMIGPLLILGFGLMFLLAPPKEATHRAGYRFWWGMASLEAWQFTQRLAGMVWSGLGLVLTVVMAILCIGIGGPDLMDVLVAAMIWIGCQGVALVAACVAIDITVVCVFDRRGFRRKEYK